MNQAVLIAAGKPRLPEWLPVFQDSFGRNSSLTTMVLTVVVLVAIPILAGSIYIFLQKKFSGGDINRPFALYRRVLRMLPLARAQRAVAWRMACDLKLPNPTILVLSAEAFDGHAVRWMQDSGGRRGEALRLSAMEGLRAALFGPGHRTPDTHSGNLTDSRFRLDF